MEGLEPAASGQALFLFSSRSTDSSMGISLPEARDLVEFGFVDESSPEFSLPKAADMHELGFVSEDSMKLREILEFNDEDSREELTRLGFVFKHDDARREDEEAYLRFLINSGAVEYLVDLLLGL
ncbi:uncharacterized protein A4U43_C09F2510 [Asparagus officinalis]|uniref:Uncharacterized protein n=1 Tax=Asparagus officinalis TaxID=4686 RepID=A0A5P1E4Q8_ASPOF|nr:uncharacterized protein A4U43_C09F2510 [Asparagus officinalis]